MPERTKAVVKGRFRRKKTGVDRRISEGVLTTSFGARGGGSLKKHNLKPPQTGGSPGDFFVSQDKNRYQDGFQKKKHEGTRASQRGPKEQVWGPVEVVL